MKKQTKDKKEPSSAKPGKEKKVQEEVTNTIPVNNLFEDEEFPGYPHYPGKEDIMDQRNNMEKKELSEENFSQQRLPGTPKKPVSIKTENNSADAGLTEGLEDSDTEEEMEADTEETDVTRDDLIALGSDELNADEGDDDLLRKRPVPVDMAGDDLDIPGSELDDEEEMIGEEDEENNSYSIGGDRHDDLEENGTDDSEERI